MRNKIEKFIENINPVMVLIFGGIMCLILLFYGL